MNLLVPLFPPLGKIVVLGVNLAAVMVLLPRMVRILMEGLIPISEAARDFMPKRAAGREVYIGLDSAVLVGHPSAISTGLLLVPIAILLSIILPGNRMLLFADLAVLPFLCSQIAPMAKGNIVRMVFVGTILLIFGFYFSNALAPVITEVAGGAGFAIPDNAVMISSIADGFVWSPLAFMLLGKYTGLDRHWSVCRPHRRSVLLLQEERNCLGQTCWRKRRVIESQVI